MLQGQAKLSYMMAISQCSGNMICKMHVLSHTTAVLGSSKRERWSMKLGNRVPKRHRRGLCLTRDRSGVPARPSVWAIEVAGIGETTSSILPDAPAQILLDVKFWHVKIC